MAATVAGDAVDREQLAKPRSWDIRSIRTFMTVFGLVSSLFDPAASAVLRIGFDAGSTLFHSGWFIESTATELAVMPVLRTNRRFWRSKPGRALLITSIAAAAITLALPYSPLARVLGLTAVPLGMLAPGLWPARAKRWGALRLTTIGRRSARERSVIVGYLEDGPNLVTLAMNGWGDAEPAWC